MSSKLFSRSGVFTWSPRGIDAKGLIVADFAQFFDPNATTIEQKIDFLDKSRLFDSPHLTPNVSVNTNYRFNELSWSPLCSDAHPLGILAGGTEDGTVVFFDAGKLVNENRLEVVSARKDHHGHVLTIDVSRDGKWMASGGGSGQILLWDLGNLKTPFSPGAPNFQDQVKLLRWNQKNESVLASISSRRVSFWDLRRHGAPVLEFGEIPNTDWSSLCWNSSDATQLIVGSQYHHCPAIQKWDSRFTSTPVKEYNIHPIGVTSIDWNKSDDRLLISSGCDGQVHIWNHETSEVIGHVPSIHNDWIRCVKWNQEEPSQLAIQYFQNQIQISSLTALGVPQPEAQGLAPRISDQFVPGWHRAPLIGASVSLGGRLATFWKSYDAQTQKWCHNVEVETIPSEEDIGAQEIAQYLHVKDDRRTLGWYLHERAYVNPTVSQKPEDVELERKVWKVLLGLQEKAGRTKMLQYLGLIDDSPNEHLFAPESPQNHTTATTTSGGVTTTHATTTTQSARSASAISASTTDSSGNEPSIVEKCTGVQWNQLGASGWELLQHAIRQDHLAVIKILMAAHQHVAAMMYAAQHETEYLTLIMEDYNRANSNTNPLSSLMMTLSSSSNAFVNSVSEEVTIQKIDEILKVYPDEKWKELLGLIVARETSTSELQMATRHLGNRWLEAGHSLRACLAFLIAGDVDCLLRANTVFPPADRLEQALVLHYGSNSDSFSAELQQFIIKIARRLLTQGSGQVAWNLVKIVQNGSAELQELQWTCYHVAGGRECTGDQPPLNPYQVIQQQQPNRQNTQPQYHQMSPNVPGGRMGGNNGYIQQPPIQPSQNRFHQFSPQSQAPPTSSYPPNRGPQNPNLAPMPPSSTFYPTPSWDHTPAPMPPPNVGPSKPTPPVTSGWNDPPPMALKTSIPQPKRNVMEINWKPADMAPAPGGMMPPTHMGGGHRNSFDQGYQQQMTAGMNGLSLQNMGNSSAASSAFPSPTSQAPQAPPPLQLTPEAAAIIEPINQLVERIIANATSQSKIQKANDLRARLQAELIPRLMGNRLTPNTIQHLMNMTYFMNANQFNECQQILSEMVRADGDFVEISSFLPSLKSLFSVALR